MATITEQKVIVGDINVKDIYKELMEASTGQGSAYIRAKETLEVLTNDSNMTEREKADMISQTLIGITNSITTGALDAAIKIATENRDAPYALAKLSADTALVEAQRAKMNKDELLTVEQISKLKADRNKTVIDGWYTQAKMITDTGVLPNVSTGTTILADQTPDVNSKAVQEIKMAQAKVHDTWAGTFRSNGNVSYALDADGRPTGLATLDSEGIVSAQTAVAKRQYQAFDDNKRQHAVNSSASMLGVLIGSSAFTNASDYSEYLGYWSDSMNYLGVNLGQGAGVLTLDAFTAPASRSSDLSVSGTVLNIQAGRTVVISVSGSTTGIVNDPNGLALVQLTDSFAYTMPSATLNAIDTDETVTVSVSVIDDQGANQVKTLTFTMP